MHIVWLLLPWRWIHPDNLLDHPSHCFARKKNLAGLFQLHLQLCLVTAMWSLDKIPADLSLPMLPPTSLYKTVVGLAPDFLGARFDHDRGLDALDASGSSAKRFRPPATIYADGDVKVERAALRHAAATAPSAYKIIYITSHSLVGILASMLHFSKQFMIWKKSLCSIIYKKKRF